MAKYTVEVKEVWTRNYTVNAKDEEHAKQVVLQNDKKNIIKKDKTPTYLYDLNYVDWSVK